MSKGERQNILIARALIAKPEILVLDEPETGLDVCAREHLMCTVRDLTSNQQITTIYVTHYPEEIQSFMNKALLLRGGHIFAQGNIEDVMTSEIVSNLVNKKIIVQQDSSRCFHMRISAPSALSSLCYVDKEES